MFLIDTDVLSALAKRRPNVNVETWIGRQRSSDLFLSVISIGEIERGISLQRRHGPDFADLQIAATALEHGLAVVTGRLCTNGGSPF